MKKYLLLFACVIATSAIFAQNQVLDNGKAEQVKQGIEFSAEGLSGMSAFLYLDLKQGTPDLEQKYDFVKVNGEWNVTALAMIKESKMALLKQYGVAINGNKALTYKSVTIPVSNFVAFVEDHVADYIEIGVKCDIKMDSARYYTNADIVQNGGGRGYSLPKGYCGGGVVVGIIDVGFDYTHRNFYDTTETTYRVKRVWDQNNSGTPPSGFNYGNELTTQSAILGALYSHNNQTHGCHVAGIAGGGGANDNNTRKFRGMAPESDLVFVSTSGNRSKLFDGIMYILDYAESVNKPCVINLSWGGHVGSHDGTESIDQNCDLLLTSYYPEGSLIVISAGNEGMDKLHQSKTFSSNDSILRTFAVTTGYQQNVVSYVDIWGQTGNTFAVKVSVVDTQTRSVIASTRFGMTSSTAGSTSIANCAIQYYIYPSASTNGKPNITLYINNNSESNAKRKVMVEVIATSGTVHEWINDGYFSSCNYSGAVAGNTNYTINAWGQGDKQIMVASYNTRKYWGSSRYSYNVFSGVGARSAFSSIGPSLTSGKIKPDIAAPGCAIISSYNVYASSYYQSAMITNTISNGNHNSVFGAMQGTSMAAPACAGILALWLEAYPQLTADQVKWLFQNYSITDSYTGTIPSTGSVYFGRGKIDALAGLQAILQKTAKPTITNSGANSICRGSSTTLSAPTGYAQYIWNTGETTRTITVSQPGSYYVRAVSAEGFKTPNSDTVNIIYRSTVSTTITGNRPICPGDRITLTVNNSYSFPAPSYQWNIGSTDDHINVAPRQTTQYWVTTSRLGFCPKTDTITVVVRPEVSTTVTPNQTICQGSSVTLSVSGGTSRNWSTGETTNSITVTPSSSISYSVTSHESGYCDKTDRIIVTVQPYVSTTISRDTTICQGQSVTLTSTGGTSRLWSNNSTSQSITVTPSQTTTYTVTSSESGKCSKTDTVTVTVRPNLITTVSSNQTICRGSSVTLSVSGGTSHNWNTGATGNSITVTPNTTTTYTVTSSQNGYCSRTDNITITVQPYVSTTISRDTTICQGQSVTLTSTGGTSKSWNTGATTNSIIVTPSTTTRYTVTSSQNGYCSTTDSVTVTVRPNVTTTVSSNQTICRGSSVTLSVSGGTSHNWSNGATGNSITVTPNTTTTYTVTSNQNGYCSRTDNITITVQPYVSTTISRDTTICQGQSVTLTSTGGTSKSWNTGATTNSIIVTPSTTTRYTVTSSQNGYCSTTDSVTVTVRPNISTTISRDTTICQGQSVTLTSTGGTSRRWSTNSTSQSITVSPSSSTTYSVTVEQNGYCPKTDVVRVNVQPYVSTTITPNQTICQGSSTTLTVNGGTSQTWSNNQTTASITVSPSQTTTYTVTSSQSGKCSTTDTVTVTVQPYVTTLTSGHPTICQGQSATLRVSGGTSHSWNNGDTTSSITVTPNTTTTYYVTSSESGKCSKTDSMTVTVQPYVSTTISRDTTICAGETLNLTVSGGTSRTWSNGATGTSITVTPSTTTRYSVVSNAVGQCSTTDSVTVTVQPYVTTLTSGHPTICVGQSATLRVSGGTSHSWNTGDTTSSITVTPNTTTSYYVTSSESGKCSKTDSMTVTVHPYVVTTISHDTSICPGEPVNLTVTGGTSWAWSNGGTTSTITVRPITPTTYTVTSSQASYCSTTDSVRISIKPSVTTTVSGNVTICRGVSVTLMATGGTSRTWSTGGTQDTIVVTPTVTTTYSVRSDSTGICSNIDSIKVTVNQLPNVVITGDTVITAGETTSLTASGAQSYLWSTGATSSSISVSPSITTSYSVTGTDANGCSNNAHATVVVNAVSIASGSELEFKVYPIPTESKLTVEGESIKTITIYNILGKVIDKIECDGEKTVVLAVKDYAQGVYVISVADTKGQTGRRTFIVR